MNILIVKPSSLGDIIHTMPAVSLVRRTLPEATISWVVNEEYKSLLDFYPDVDQVIVFRRNHWQHPRSWPEVLSFPRLLRTRKFDLALDFQGLFRSGLITRLSRASRRIGFSQAREKATLFYTDKIKVPQFLQHAVERNLFLVREALQIKGTAVAETSLEPGPEEQSRMTAILTRHRLSPDFPIMAVAPAARWQSKMWPPKFFAEVLSHLWRDKPELPALLLGSRAEREIGEQIEQQCAGQGRIVNLMGETELGTLISILGRTNLLLTNDSGPMHLAAILGTPVVALFGATDPNRTGPYGDIHRVFLGKCDFSPCLKHRCNRADSGCHLTVSAEQVAHELEERVETKKIAAIP